MEGVRRRPGFVHGYWTFGVENPSVNVSFVVWESRERAEEVRQSVLGNVAAQLQPASVTRGCASSRWTHPPDGPPRCDSQAWLSMPRFFALAFIIRGGVPLSGGVLDTARVGVLIMLS